MQYIRGCLHFIRKDVVVKEGMISFSLSLMWHEQLHFNVVLNRPAKVFTIADIDKKDKRSREKKMSYCS